MRYLDRGKTVSVHLLKCGAYLRGLETIGARDAMELHTMLLHHSIETSGQPAADEHNR